MSEPSNTAAAPAAKFASKKQMLPWVSLPKDPAAAFKEGEDASIFVIRLQTQEDEVYWTLGFYLPDKKLWLDSDKKYLPDGVITHYFPLVDVDGTFG